MKTIRVLIIDDSAFARKVIREVLSRDPEIEVVGIARDGIEALEKINELKPDVITLDLIMPDLDGIGVLKALRDLSAETAPRVIVVSVSGSDTELAIDALELGAVDLVTKPTPLPTDRLYELSNELVIKVKTAALASPRSTTVVRAAPVAVRPQSLIERIDTRLVVIGTSTGGPQALTQLFEALPAGLPVTFAIALHIPSGYTRSLAERLSRVSGVHVDEAVQDMEFRPGQAILAQGGMHLRVKERNGGLFADVSHAPEDSLYFPSVNVLFESAAREVGKRTLGVVMTGMGDDGTRGARSIRDAGGRVLTEAASSCVVYGMPRSVTEAGLSHAQARLEDLPRLLMDSIYGLEKRSER